MIWRKDFKCRSLSWSRSQKMDRSYFSQIWCWWGLASAEVAVHQVWNLKTRCGPFQALLSLKQTIRRFQIRHSLEMVTDKRWWSTNTFTAFQKVLNVGWAAPPDVIQSCWTGITSHTELPVNKRCTFIGAFVWFPSVCSYAGFRHITIPNCCLSGYICTAVFSVFVLFYKGGVRWIASKS